MCDKSSDDEGNAGSSTATEPPAKKRHEDESGKALAIVSSSPPPPVLSEDILYEIAEKMLCKKVAKDQDKIDLTRVNGYTNFMRFNRIAAKVFFAQFVKMKEIEFNGGTGALRSDPLKSEPSIKLYRSEEKSRISDDNEFYGPYFVKKEFVGALIDYGKLRLKSIKTKDYLEKTLPAAIKVKKASAEVNKCKSSIQSFCKLFLHKELSDAEASNIFFDLDKLWIDHESTKLLRSNFDELLNLNAREIVLELMDKLFDTNLLNRTMQADRVEKLSLNLCWESFDYTRVDKVKLHWESFIDLLLVACPNIQLISIYIEYGICEWVEPEEVLFEFGELVGKFAEQLFPTLSKGNPGLQILSELKLYGKGPDFEELFVADDRLSKIGKEIVVPRYFARECEIVDQIGRQHKCRFRVFKYWSTKADEDET